MVDMVIGVDGVFAAFQPCDCQTQRSKRQTQNISQEGKI